MAKAACKLARRGFSLVEALIVIAIMAVLATMSLGTFMAARPHAILEREELALSAALSDARNMAVSEEIPVRLVFDEAGGAWYRQKLVGGNWQTSGTQQSLNGVDFDADGVAFTSDTIEFTARGSLMSGGSITIVASNGETGTLTGNVASGRFPITGGNTR